MPASAAGGMCNGGSGLSCPADQLCVGASGSTPGTCTPLTDVLLGAEGDTCDLQAFSLCASNLSCAITGAMGTTPTETCVAVVSAGGSCNAAIPEMCPTGQYCDAQPLMGMFDGTCRPLPGDGEACAQTFSGTACASGLSCDSGTCRAQQDNGASCMDNGQCYSGNCEMGTCQPSPLCM